MVGKYLCVVTLMMFGAAGGANATVILDPLGIGDTKISPGLSSFTTLSPSSIGTNFQITLGFGGVAGTLEINGSSAGNGYTSVFGNGASSIGANIGLGASSPGRLIVRGGNFETLGSIEVGISTGANGQLEVIEGGTVSATREGAFNGSGITLGNGDGASGTALIDGAGSRLQVTDRIRVGGFDNTTGDLTISNGGFAGASSDGTNGNFDGVVTIGTGTGASGLVTVTGSGSLLETGGLIIGDGNNTNARLRIENGGTVTTTQFSDFSGLVSVGSQANSMLEITGAGSKLQISPVTTGFFAGRELVIGGFAAGTVTVDDNGLLDVSGGNIELGIPGFSSDPGLLNIQNGGKVIADTITVGQAGTLAGGGGIIEADVVVNGGTVAPGNSPGTMTIDGNADFSTGVLELEITQAATDLLIVTGDLTLGDDFMLSLLFDFDPVNYILDLDDLFDITGNFLTGPNFNLIDNLNIFGLSNSSSLTVNFQSDQRIFGNPGGGSSIAEPAPLALLGFGLLGLAFARRRRSQHI